MCVHKAFVDATGRNAVAANVVLHVVLGDGVGHGDYGAFTGRVGKAVAETGGASDGSNVDNHAAAVGFHMRDARVDAVVIALHVDEHHAIEIGFGSVFNVSDVRNSGVIDKEVDAFFREDSGTSFVNGRLIGDVASKSSGVSAVLLDESNGGLRVGKAQIQNANSRASSGEAK